MNATIQALAEYPFLRSVLEKELQSAENPKAKVINACRKQLLEVLTALQSSGENREPFSRAEANKLLKFFLDLLVKDPGYCTKDSSLNEKLTKPMDAALFLEFLADYLGLSFELKGIRLNDAAVESFEELVATTKSKKALVRSDGPELLALYIADRLSITSDKAKTTKVFPSETLSSAYKLCAVICNPSDTALSGHYITYAPKAEPGAKGWVEYNDSLVSVGADADTERQAIIEQHSYLYLYTKIATTK